MTIFRLDPQMRASKAGYEKSRFSTNISLYLRNDTRHGHSYCVTPTGTLYSILYLMLQFPVTKWPLTWILRSRHYLTLQDKRHSCNGILIGTYTCTTQGRHFEWPWVTLMSWRNILWHEVSRGLSVTAELLVSYTITCVVQNLCPLRDLLPAWRRSIKWISNLHLRII